MTARDEAETVPLTVHYAPAGRVSACRRIKGAVRGRPDMTADPALVTCKWCKFAPEYEEAVR